MLKKSKEEFFRQRACAHTSRPAVYKKRVHMEEKAMMIRNTRMEEVEEVMRMYAQAAQYMAQTGNSNQWEQGYPQRGLIADDIGRGVSYVLEHEGQIEAVFSYIEGEDATYGRIENGAWRSAGLYGTVHRLASARRQRGVARQCFLWCEEQAAAHGCSSLRVDTHMDNRVMQHILTHEGFAYCGVIRLADGAPRLAYEKVLRQSAPLVGNTAGEWNQPAQWDQSAQWNSSAQWDQSAQWNPAMETRIKEKGDGIAVGVASMVLGIVSLLMFCTCLNFIIAIIAIVLGIIQLNMNKEKSGAIVGIVTGAASLVLSVILWMLFIISAPTDTYYDSYDTYYDSYDYNDLYYDDYEEEGGEQFL